MNLYYKIYFTAALCLTVATGFAQSQSDAQTLIKEGVELNNQKNYTGAIAKYQEALKADPDNGQANYQLAFSLNASGKGMDGIPYLQKAVKSNASANTIGGAYDLMGGIYDQAHQPQKAIDSYLEGIKANPAYQTLRYNLGLAYFRNKQYAEAESSAAEAIKLDPKHAGSQRLYALVTFHQNKRAAALLGFCSFLLLEPQTTRSAEAYGNIQHILQGGVLKAEPGQAQSHAVDANSNALNLAITHSVAAMATRRYASQADLLAAQLKAIFTAVGSLADKQTGNDFFKKYYAAYFNQLAQTTNMPAFARLVSLTTPESAKWAKDNAQQMADLDNWIKSTERGF